MIYDAMNKLLVLAKTSIFALITGSIAIYLISGSDSIATYIQKYYPIKQQIVPSIIAGIIYITSVGFVCLSIRLFSSVFSICAKKPNLSKDS